MGVTRRVLLQALKIDVVEAEAANGEEAKTILTASDNISLLVTDVSMPKLDGSQLVATILRQRPELRTGVWGDNKFRQIR